MNETTKPAQTPTAPAVGSDPRGYTFRDARLGEMMLVYEGAWKGWLVRRHPDGQWVTLRKATPEDWRSLGCAITQAHHNTNTERSGGDR